MQNKDIDESGFLVVSAGEEKQGSQKDVLPFKKSDSIQQKQQAAILAQSQKSSSDLEQSSVLGAPQGMRIEEGFEERIMLAINDTNFKARAEAPREFAKNYTTDTIVVPILIAYLSLLLIMNVIWSLFN